MSGEWFAAWLRVKSDLNQQCRCYSYLLLRAYCGPHSCLRQQFQQISMIRIPTIQLTRVHERWFAAWLQVKSVLNQRCYSYLGLWAYCGPHSWLLRQFRQIAMICIPLLPEDASIWFSHLNLIIYAPRRQRLPRQHIALPRANAFDMEITLITNKSWVIC